MCECIEKVEAKLAEKNTRLHLAFSCSGEPTKVMLGTEKIDSKVRGKPVNLISAYCPFCGVKYECNTSP